MEFLGFVKRDIAKFKSDDPTAVIGNWMRNRNIVILIPSNSRGLKEEVELECCVY